MSDDQTKEEFEENPCCQACGEGMFLSDGCEWPDDESLWLCHSCIYDHAENMKTERDEARRIAEELNAFRFRVLEACDDVPNPDPLPWEISSANVKMSHAASDPQKP